MALPDVTSRPPSDLEESAAAFTEHFDYVCRALRRFGVASAHVEDVAQDVFVVMCRRWRHYQADRPLQPWLAGIAFNLAHRHRSRAWRETPKPFVDCRDERPTLDEQIDSARARRLVLAALDALPPRDRAVMALHEIEDLPMQEVAALLSVPLFTAYTRLRRARQRFAKAVHDLQSRERSQHPALSPAALLTLERQPQPPRADAELQARRLVRAALPKLASWSPGPAPARPAPLGKIGLGLATLAVGAAVVWPTAAPRSRPVRAAASAPARAIAPRGLDVGLAGYWRLDDGPGSTVARDLSGAGQDCVLRGIDARTAWTGGAFGGALDLGRGSLDCPRAARAQPTGALSVSAWVRISERRGQRSIVGRQLGDGHEDEFQLSLMWGRLKVRSTVWRKALLAEAPIPAGRWVHVAFTHGQDGTTRLYQDGREVGRGQSVPLNRELAQTPPVVIGADANGPDGTARDTPLSGTVDEVAIFDRALTAEEIGALAAGASLAGRPGAVRDW